MIPISKQIVSAMAGRYYTDFCAGIGGFALACESVHSAPILAAELDKECRRMYAKNFDGIPRGHIAGIHPEEVPHHDIMCAGLPCPSFSWASGKPLGLNDPRGRVYGLLHPIILKSRPTTIILENVPAILTDDQGRTWAVIRSCLTGAGYEVFQKILIGSEFGQAQCRSRLYIVALRRDLGVREFRFPQPTFTPVRLRDHLQGPSTVAKFRMSLARQGLRLDRELAESEILPRFIPLRVGTFGDAGQGERIYHTGAPAPTICSGGGGGANTRFYYDRGVIRTLSPRECARLFGFPDTFKLHPDPTTAIRQLGNSVCVDVVQHLLIALAEQVFVGRER